MIQSLTIHQFAKKIGVSTATVWRALHSNTRIKPETAQFVHQKIEELGYRPSWAARALVTGRTNTVSIFAPTVRTTYSHKVLDGLWDALRHDRYDMMIRPSDNELESNYELMQRTSLSSDGIFVIEWGGVMLNLRELLLNGKGFRRPIVCLGSMCPPQFDSVLLDIYSPTVEAIRHLADIGCQRILYLMIPLSDAGDAPRHRAATTCHKEFGLTVEHLLAPSEGYADIEAALEAYVRENGWPDGIMCLNDDFAIFCHHIAQRHGLKIPDDLAIVGCDGLISTDYLDAPISTIQYPIAEMCDIAWQFLQDRIQDPSLPVRSETIKCPFVIKGSSRR